MRSKMYSQDCGENNIKQVAKGIKKCVNKRDNKHHIYREALLNEKITYNKMTNFRTYEHQLYTIEMNKIGLSPYDDKRFVLNDKIHTYAYGHYKSVLIE